MVTLLLWLNNSVKVTFDIFFSEDEWKNTLRFVRIFFKTPSFDRVTKEKAAKFVDYVSAIGGTMGLLTGFSIISGIEIFYFAVKIVFKILKKNISN